MTMRIVEPACWIEVDWVSAVKMGSCSRPALSELFLVLLKVMGCTSYCAIVRGEIGSWNRAALDEAASFPAALAAISTSCWVGWLRLFEVQ